MSDYVEQELNKRNRWVYFTKYRWVAHVAYWTFVLVYGTLMEIKEPITAKIIFHSFFLTNLNIAIFYYLYCLFLIPYLFKRNKILLFWVSLLLSFFVLTTIDLYFNLHFVQLGSKINTKMDFWHNYSSVVYGYVINFMLFTMVLFFMEKNEENNLSIEMEEEKKEIETVKLDLLKTNISPDFLMRSLKQLKRSAIQEEDYTPQSIVAFSELLRYRLYRGKQLQSPLVEELEALKTFITFISFDHQNNNLCVKLEVIGETEGKFIAALSLINLLEAFCKVIPEKPASLNFKLVIEGDILHLSIVYNQQAKGQLLEDLNKYGRDYKMLYDDTVQFGFENCVDETCKIEMNLPLL